MTERDRVVALMLMDYQKAMCLESGLVGKNGLAAEIERRAVLAAASNTLRRFRERGELIIHIRLAFDPHYHRMTSASKRFRSFKQHGWLQDGDPMAEICDPVAPLKDEIVLTKGSVNPFVGTHLAQTLVGHRVTELVLGGVATNHVVESTARLGADLGYSVVVLEDLCAGQTRALHEFSVEQILPFYARVTSSDAFLAELAGEA